MVCWDVEGHGCLRFNMGGINISGRIKQSFYPRTRHGELKVISMIYAPPYLIRRRRRRWSRSHARNVSDGNPGSTHDGKHWKANNGAPLLLRSITRSRRHHTTRQRGTDLSSRTVTSSLSGVSVTHDEYRTFYGGSSCLATGDQTTVINMASTSNHGMTHDHGKRLSTK